MFDFVPDSAAEHPLAEIKRLAEIVKPTHAVYVHPEDAKHRNWGVVCERAGADYQESEYVPRGRLIIVHLKAIRSLPA